MTSSRKSSARGVRAIGLALILVWPGASIGEQPAVNKPEPVALTVRDVLKKAAMRYRTGPVCERVSVEVRPEVGRISRSAFVLKLDPRRTDAKPATRIYFELGAIQVLAADGRVVAAHMHNPGTYYTTTLAELLTSHALRTVMPPLPVVQLDLLNWSEHVDADLPRELGVYAQHIEWEQAVADPRQPNRATVSGRCDGGTLTMVVATDVVQSMEVRLDAPKTLIRMSFSRVLPCRAENVALDTSGRIEVKSLTELQPRSGILRSGSTVPEMQLTAASGRGVKLKELFVPPAEFHPIASTERLVMVFVREDRARIESGERVVGRVRLGELAAELKRIRRESMLAFPAALNRPDAEKGEVAEPSLPSVNFAQVIVWDKAPPADVLLTLLKSEREVWGDQLAWTTEPKSTAELFTGSGESVVVVLDSSQRLMSAIPMNESTTTEQLVDQVTLAVIVQNEDRAR